MKRQTSTALCATTFLALTLGAQLAAAQNGVSDDRVKLPEGPGSLEGIGENADVDEKMGQASWSIPIDVPRGYAGVTPELALTYSSGGGGSVTGMGWLLDLPFIERRTVRGLPKYDGADQFAVSGSLELVRLPGSSTFRARFEGGFVRYTWESEGDGAEGYWRAEMPDGSVAWYGADSGGKSDPKARLSGPAGTFRWHVVEVRDVHGHRSTWRYDNPGGVPLLQTIGWVYAADDDSSAEPHYELAFAYETRADLLSDCKAGFDERLGFRLGTITVRVSGETLRTYHLAYEDYAASGGFTRLGGVSTAGADGGKYPIGFTFSYSQALGSTCQGAGCLRPYLVTIGSLGVDLKSGLATLVDMNGDSLPDVVHTPDGEKHRIFVSHLATDGTHTFEAPAVSGLDETNGLTLAQGAVQPLDVDGDGFTDLLLAKSGQFLSNTGTGDWAGLLPIGGTIPDFAADFDVSDGELGTIRFLDADNDKRIDILIGLQDSTTIFRSTPGGFALLAGVEDIGVGFDSGTLDLADMNGDGLQDVVQLTTTQLRYRLNLGWGHWADWKEIKDLEFTEAEMPAVELEDLNGDALTDLVLVQGSQVRYALSRNGTSFVAAETVSEAGGDSLPQRTADMTVLYADMNANGSDDVVWIDASGKVTYLELFPTRPNLLTRIENGIGMVVDFTYGTMAEHRERDAEEASGWTWAHATPSPMGPEPI